MCKPNSLTTETVAEITRLTRAALDTAQAFAYDSAGFGVDETKPRTTLDDLVRAENAVYDFLATLV